MEQGLDFDVVVGLDVGKAAHHAVALDRGGRRLIDREVANTEDDLRAVLTRAGQSGRILVVVAQLNSIGALPVAVAHATGTAVEYLPGLSMRRLADLHPGNAKTDARDAFGIANAALTAPHALRALDIPSEAQADLSMLLGYDDDLAEACSAAISRLRGLLVHIHPSLGKSLEDTCPTRPSFACSSGQAGQPGCARSAGPGSTGSSPSTHPASTADSRPRSGTASPPRPSSFPAPPRPPRSCPGSRTKSCSSATNASRSPKTSRGSSMPTLLPKS